MEALKDYQRSQGGQFSHGGVLLSLGQDPAALAAATTSTVLIDRSHWGLLEMAGQDRLRFIHNQTTNTFTQRQAGEVCDTVFVTSTARTLDLTTVYITENSLLILTSPDQDQRLFDWMDRYIFPADQVTLTNLSGQWAIFSLVGPNSASLLQNVGLTAGIDLAEGQHQSVAVEAVTWYLAAGSGLALPGYTLLMPQAVAATLWQQITTAGAIPAGSALWEQLRIQQGRPQPGAELSDHYNPLEAGLWHTISFDKGCYIGQETIARLNTYQGVKQQLWGIHLSEPVTPGEDLWLAGEKVGRLTSVVDTPAGCLGLGYVRTKAGGAGLTVTVGSATGQVVDLPFLSRGYLAPSAGGSAI